MLECPVSDIEPLTPNARAHLKPEPVKVVLVHGIKTKPTIPRGNPPHAIDSASIGQGAHDKRRVYGHIAAVGVAAQELCNLNGDAEPIRADTAQDTIGSDGESKRWLCPTRVHTPNSFEGVFVGIAEPLHAWKFAATHSDAVFIV